MVKDCFLHSITRDWVSFQRSTDQQCNASDEDLLCVADAGKIDECSNLSGLCNHYCNCFYYFSRIRDPENESRKTCKKQNGQKLEAHDIITIN